MTPNPAPAPGDDGDRDEENPDIEPPVPVTLPTWQDEMKYYHSHLCGCPICAAVESQHKSRMKEWIRLTSQW